MQEELAPFEAMSEPDSVDAASEPAVELELDD
jgi:hypothetical protein